MQLPRPESRLSALEALTSLHTARIKELEVDTAESLRELKHDLKQLEDGMMSSFKKIGDTIIDTLATKDDISSIHTRFDKVEGDISELKSMMKQLLQQKSGE
jgi:transcriptional regulator NrdR family protein